MYIHLDGVRYPYPEVSIDRTVFLYDDAGLYIEGCNPDPNFADPNQVVPKIKIVNSCFMMSYFSGLHKDDTAALIDLNYCAFAENTYNATFDLSVTGCIGLDEAPFYLVGNDKKLYISQDSELVDAGYGFAEDGTGTCPDWPDIGQMDIGCHFPIGVSGSFGIPSSPADFNADGIVDELDLQLMNDCMGAIADPNIVRIDTNYDSRVDLPDFGLFAVDYGYDPNNPDNNDPNSERSDFNSDRRVDLADLDVLAQNWLTLVFDEYRICGLCNIGVNTEPNDPNAPPEPDTSNIIDSKDYDALMADWHKQFFSDPNISVAQSASQLSIAVENPDPAWKISAFFDDEPIGQWTAGELGSSAFDVDLTRYGPGSHKVKVVRNIGYGLEITERIVSDPNSTGLYFADIPDSFEPNEPYHIHGFNLNDGELKFKVGNIRNETIYDVNVPSGAVNLEIPASAFGQSMLATLSAAAASTMPENEDRYEKILEQKFDREKYRGAWVRFLVLLPSSRVTATYRDAVFAALAAIEKRVPGYPYIVLTGTDVNYENLKFSLYYTYGTKIVVFFGHANSYVNSRWVEGDTTIGVQRTIFQCYEKTEGYFWDSYDNVGVVSYTINTKKDAQPLPDSRDNTVIDFTRLLRGSYFLPIDQMYVFGCLSAAYDDMAVAQGCGGLHDHAAQDMLYVGFNKAPLQNNGKWILVPGLQDLGTKVVQGLVIFFQQLGDGKKVNEARQYLESGYVENGIKEAVFQRAGLTFYGLGYGNVRFGAYGAKE